MTMIRRRFPIRRSTTRIRVHAPKRQKIDLGYRAWLREWPCFICFMQYCSEEGLNFWDSCKAPFTRWAFAFNSKRKCGPTQAAHVGSKGIGQKCPEREMMPLGLRHHLHPTAGGFPDSHHAGKRTFWLKHKLSRPKVLEFLRKLYLKETGSGQL